MQENNLTCYGRIISTKTPQATGANARGEQTFNLNATLRTSCGGNRTDGVFTPEVRDVEVVFIGHSAKQIELLAPNSEVFINGATVITTNVPQRYPLRMLDQLVEDGVEESELSPDAIVNFIAECVAIKTGRMSESIAKQLQMAFPRTRPKTLVRVKPGQWALKASEKQVANGMSLEGFDAE